MFHAVNVATSIAAPAIDEFPGRVLEPLQQDVRLAHVIVRHRVIRRRPICGGGNARDRGRDSSGLDGVPAPKFLRRCNPGKQTTQRTQRQRAAIRLGCKA